MFLRTAAYRNGLVSQSRIQHLFDGRVELVHVDVEDRPLQELSPPFCSLYQFPTGGKEAPVSYHKNLRVFKRTWLRQKTFLFDFMGICDENTVYPKTSLNKSWVWYLHAQILVICYVHD